MLKKMSLAEKIKKALGIGKDFDALCEDLEEVLISGDIGPRVAMEVIDRLREKVKKEKLKSVPEQREALRDIIASYIKVYSLVPEKNRLNFYLVLGVNGVGKTTTIAKMTDYYRKHHNIGGILLSAGDTFRAAAIEQLSLHAERLNVKVVGQEKGADPGAVIFDTITHAHASGSELVLADTAGRMHNKASLVRELQKIDKIIRGKIANGYYRKVLVLDATTGQNAYNQAETFNEAIGIDTIVLAKYDSTAKGGIVLSISHTLGIPFSFMGTGEKLDDFIPFDKRVYLDSLIGESAR
ncbi:MAG: signal recognition particle-docking protein FtsY [Spirochaetales bacterium]|nr:signal recognition particle-docking protein FtsY [Spirochaetales bacterium]